MSTTTKPTSRALPWRRQHMITTGPGLRLDPGVEFTGGRDQ
jgi:hypothetical protein